MKSFKHLLVILFSIFVLDVAFVYAQSDDSDSPVSIVVKQHSRDAYEIVSKPGGKTKKGLYVFKGKEDDSVPLVYGEVLGATKRNPGAFLILNEELGPDYELVMAVIDGKIMIIRQNKASPTSSSGRLTLGQPSSKTNPAVPLKEPYSKVDVVLAPITDEGNISYISASRPNGERIVLVSVKQPMPIAGSDGVTFGFVIDAGSNKGASPTIDITEPYILDYRFLTNADLQRHIQFHKYSNNVCSLHSPILLRALIKKWENVEANPLMNLWRQQAKTILRYISPQNSSDAITPAQANLAFNAINLEANKQYIKLNTPMINLQDGTVESPPSTTQYVGLTQSFDPVERGFEISPVDSSHKIPGRISWNPKKSQYEAINLLSVSPSFTTQTASLIKIDDKILLHATNDSVGPIPLDLTSAFEQIEVDPFDPNVAIAYRKVSGERTSEVLAQAKKGSEDIRNLDPAESFHFIFVSARNARGKNKTVVFRVSQQNHTFKLGDPWGLDELGPFKLTKDELNLRISDHSGYGLVFDHHTKASGAKAYQAILNKKSNDDGSYTKFSPYTALFEQNARKKIIYLHPRATVPLHRLLQYKEFGIAGDKNENSGLYLGSTQTLFNDDELVTPGYLIYTLKKSKYDADRPVPKAVIHTEEIAVGEPQPYEPESQKRRVSMVGMLTQPHKSPQSVTKFKLVVYVHTSDAVDGLNEIEIPFAFESIEGVQIFQGLRQKRNSLYILFFVKKSPAFAGGVYSISYSLAEDRSPAVKWPVKISPKPEGAGWLSKAPVKISIVPKHLAVDENGGIYWADSAEIPVFDKKYRVRSLDSPKRLINPSDDDTQISINPREVLTMGDKNGGKVTWFGSRWELSSYGDYKSISPQLNQILEGQDKAKQLEALKKLESEQAKAQPLYSDLDNFLSTELLAKNTRGSKRLLVVSEEDYSRFLNLILGKAALGVKDWHSVSFSSPLHLYYFNGKAGAQEIRREILNAASESGNTVLLAGSDEILEASQLEASKESDEPRSILDIDYSDHSPAKISEPPQDNKESKDNPDGETESSEGDGEESEEWDTDEGFENDTSQSEDSSSLSEEPNLNTKYRKDPKAAFKPTGLFLIATEGRGHKLSDLEDSKSSTQSLTTVILTTPRKLAALKLAHPHEFNSGLVGDNGFIIDNRFLRSPWYTWNPGTARVTADIKQMSVSALTVEDLQVFPNLRTLLSDVSGHQTKPERTILVVPRSLKDLISRYIWTHWASRYSVVSKNRRQTEGFWNFRNPNLKVFRFPHGSTDSITQENVYESLGAMRSLSENSGQTVVLVADATDILKVGRPVPSEESPIPAFKIADPAAVRRSELMASSQNTASDTTDTQSEHKASRVFPHTIWWLASQGKRIQPKLSNNWRLRDEVEPSFSQIILATPEEVQDIKKDLGVESTFMDLNEDFRIIELSYPSLEHRAGLLQALFLKDEIRALGYKFSMKGVLGVSGTNAGQVQLQKVTEFLASRVEAVARSLGQEPIEAYIRAYTFFRRALIEDPSLRRTKLIDEEFIERFLSRVFPIPLNLKTLEPDDVLKKIEDVGRASVDLIRLGHAGQLALKEQVLRLILSQTQGSDSSKQIPASAVFYGTTSLGKTYLFEKIVELLKLKVYDFNRPQDTSAQAFMLKVEDLVDSDEQSTSKNLSVTEALKHLDHFLTLPLGYRGFVLIDDLHKARSSKVLAAVMQYVQNLLNNNMVRAKNLDGKVAIEIPVRNIVLVITINPASSRQIREDFVDDEGSIESRIVAALSQVQGANYETSVLARFGALIDFDNFPREAKASGLIKRIRKRSNENLTLQQRLVLVNPHILSDLAEMFPHAHARNFLSPVTNELFSQVSADLDDAAFYYITGKENPGDLKDEKDDERFDFSKSSDEGTQMNSAFIRKKISRKVVVKPVQVENIRSRLEFTEFMVNSLRINLFNSLIDVSQNLPVISGTFERRMDFLLPLLGASMHTLRERQQIPFWALKLNPNRFGISQSAAQVLEMETLLATKREEEKPFFPLSLSGVKLDPGEGFDSFAVGSASGLSPRSQQDVMVETVEQLRAVLQPLHYKFFRSNQFTETSAEEWFAKLRAQKSVSDDLKLTSEKLLNIYLRFISLSGIMNPNLQEVVKGQSDKLTPYDLAMLFFICLDRAVTQLAWDSGNDFMVKMLSQITADSGLSSRAEFIQYAFEAEDSALAPITVEYVGQLLEGNDLVVKHDDYIKNGSSGYADRCEYLFKGGVNAELKAERRNKQ